MEEDPPFTVEGDDTKSVKKKKAKKRPSDFEITRTILQRTHERKLPFLLKDMGEDSDILFFCSEEEKGFTYGSCDLALAILEIHDPELNTIVTSYLSKLYGFHSEKLCQRVVNIRDQFSELTKTKGESIDVVVEKSKAGSIWTIKTDVNGVQKELYYTKAIDSLFHMQRVKIWCDQYRPLLTTDNEDHLYYPYHHPDSATDSVLILPPPPQDHRLYTLYPYGFRCIVTKGIDVITAKFLEEFPYPIIKEELVVFTDHSSCVQIAHRICAQGWNMILLRPHAIFFPVAGPLLSAGSHSL